MRRLMRWMVKIPRSSVLTESIGLVRHTRNNGDKGMLRLDICYGVGACTTMDMRFTVFHFQHQSLTGNLTVRLLFFA